MIDRISLNRVFKAAAMMIAVLCSNAQAESLIAKAEQYKAQNNLYKSNYYYLASILDNQDLEQAHYGLAENLYMSREYPRALQNLEQLLVLDPDHAQALILRARIYSAMDDTAALLKEAKRLEALPVQDQGVLRALDSAYSTLGRLDKAREYKRRAAGNNRETQRLPVNQARPVPR